LELEFIAISLLKTMYDFSAGNESLACTMQALLAEGLSFVVLHGKLS
jgi:hypothetical protein